MNKRPQRHTDLSLRLFSGLLLLLFLAACQTTKRLPEGEKLYSGTQLKMAKPKSAQPNKALRAELTTKIKQQPNKKILGQRFKLWVYQRLEKHQKERGFRHWLKTRIGEPPAYYDLQQTELSRRLMERHLRNNGFLHAQVRVDTIVGAHDVRTVYRIDGKGQYRINAYHLPPDTTQLFRLIRAQEKKALLLPGKPFSTFAIDAERERIKDLARNAGYYDFDPSNVYFFIDTSQQNRSLDIYLSIQSPANKANYQPYRLGQVTIYPDYRLDATSGAVDTLTKDDFTMIGEREVVKLFALREAIAQDSGALYSQTLESQAINYLLDFGIFKFVNLKYQKDTVGDQPVLQRYYYLTPRLNQDVGVSLEASTERSNFLGYSASVNYTHRNLFRGAERFETRLSFGAETQAGGGGPFINTLEASFSAGLSVPRLWLPFRLTRRLKNAIPKTVINLNADIQKRNTLFTSASVQLELGYTWKQNQNFQHQFYPFQLTLLNLLTTSAVFEAERAINPRLLASFDDLFILGLSYRFTYTNQRLNSRKNYAFFRVEAENAGNVAQLFGRERSGATSKYLFGAPIAQFLSLQVEGRYNWFQRKTALAGRIIAGWALPYGNSESVPYIRQFFVGGASSIRAFRFRGVGPGSLSDASDGSSNLALFDRVGEIKLESSLEYRMPFIGYLKSALFVDAGNVWLGNQSTANEPAGRFAWNRFYKEIAVGTGLGLRLEIQYIVIRLDVAFPLRDPARPDGDRWTVSKIQLGSRNWRRDNLIYNLAVGYPF